MNAVKTFIDTNILVYAFTADEPEKQEAALKALNKCMPVVSAQVIKEFSNVLLRKTNADTQTIKDTINDIITVADVVAEEIELILASFDIHERYKFSFYDSLIVTAALNSKCEILLSEDMQDGQIIGERLKIVNPLQ